MAVPASSHPCWIHLAEGALKHLRSNHLGTQLMTKRLEKSSAPIDEKAAQIRAFFERWEMVLPDEVSQLTSL